MNKFKFTIALAMIMMLFACKNMKVNTEALLDRKVDSVFALMNIDEKIGQLTLYTSDYDVTGPTIRASYKEDVKSGRVGAIFNAVGTKYTRELQKLAVENSRLHIPLIFGYDVIHGYKTIFPIPLGESASWDLEAIENSARIAALEASASGLHWTFAPMVDIARDPRWGRIAEGAGEDTYLGSLIAAARVKGFQGQDFSGTSSVLACAKHYAAYGAALAGRDYNTVDMSERTLREVYLPPFHAACNAGAATFMTSFNEIAGVPSTANKQLLTDILRGEWGFKGFVVTDYTSINEMVQHGNCANEKEAGELAINAGVDMDMQGAVYNNYLKKSIEENKVNIEQVNAAVKRILRMKFMLGLFADPYKFCDEEREKKVVFAKENLDYAREVAKKSIVLLKNSKSVLPLSKNIKSLALIGPLANNKSELIGNWSGQGDWHNAVSLLDGVKQKVSAETKLLYAKGCNINDDSTNFAEALKVAQNADVIVLALGEGAWMSGEASSRSNINLPGVQNELYKEILKLGKPLVVVLMNGRPLTIQHIANTADAILETWFAGTRAGDAIADVLFGDYNPSGKLTATFPRSVGQIPLYYNAKNTGRPFDEKNKYTSKYLDIQNTPLYPFGFGLSYTTFSYSDVKVNKDSISMTDTLQISVTVKNTGKIAGEEVVQLYVRDLVGSVTRPVKELKGFKKLMLQSGESKEIVFKLTSNDLAFYTLDMTFKAEKGDFKVFVGTNSVDVKEAKFKIY